MKSAEQVDPIATTGPRSRLSLRTALGAVAIALVLAFAGMTMCDYAFGRGDQLQYLVDVVATEDPGALGDDAYLRAFEALRSTFWVAMAAVSTEDTLPWWSMIVAFAAAALAALGSMRLATAIAEDRRRGGIDLVVGLAAGLAMLVPKESNWFGLVSLSDVELTATSAAIPLAIAAMLAWTVGRNYLTLVISCLVAVLHAQTAAYLLTAWVVVAVYSWRRSPRHLILPLLLAIAGTFAILRERAGNIVAPENLDRFEEIGSSMYVELLDPWQAGISAWGAVLAILALGLFAAISIGRMGMVAAGPRRAAMLWTLATLCFPALGLTLLAIGMREPLVWRLMVGRSFMLPQIAALAFFAAWAVMTMRRGGVRGIAAAVALLIVSWWPFADWPLSAATVALAGAIGLVAFDAITRRRDDADDGFNLAPIGVGITSVVLGVLTIMMFIARPYPWTEEAVDPGSRSAELWARENTDPGTRFLTPPHRPGWRIGAHRPTFGELNDGGLFFYAGEEALAWADRMELLGQVPRMRARAEIAGPEYAASVATLDEAWFDANGIAYLVTEVGHDVQRGTVVWTSEQYIIRQMN